MATITRLQKSRRMSQIVQHGSTIHLAGQIADDCAQAIDGQSQEVFCKIDTLLAQIGLTKSAIVFAEIWLSDLADFAGFNSAWEAWVDPESPPGRATCQVGLARAGARIEILVTASAES
ncbi:RidA family protein [Bosea massiliensis]|uniref:RidA family protein n=1 Tax=Bosea massiliensis TaxID=151419 RepID=A0ABW0P864_9HYPH